MAKSTNCRHYTLARNEVAHVQGCSECGCISIHLGPVTVRLDDGSLDALWEVLGDASAELRMKRAGAISPARNGLAS